MFPSGSRDRKTPSQPFFSPRPRCRAKAKLHGTRRARTFTASDAPAGASFPDDRVSKNRCGFSRPAPAAWPPRRPVNKDTDWQLGKASRSQRTRPRNQRTRHASASSRATAPKAGMAVAWPAGRKSRTLARSDQSCIRAGGGSRIARPSHHRAARVGRRRRAGERESTSTSSGRLPRVLE